MPGRGRWCYRRGATRRCSRARYAGRAPRRRPDRSRAGDTDPGVVEREEVEAAERRRVLVLLSAGDLGLDRLEPPGIVRELEWRPGDTLEGGEGGDDGDVERAGTAEPGSGRHVGAGGEGERRGAGRKRRAAEWRTRPGSSTGVSAPHDLHLGAELTGAEQVAMLASHRLGAGEEPDGSGDDGARPHSRRTAGRRSRRRRNRAARVRQRGRHGLVRDVPLAQGHEFTPGVHPHAQDATVHALDAARVIEKGGRDRIEEQLLRGHADREVRSCRRRRPAGAGSRARCRRGRP